MVWPVRPDATRLAAPRTWSVVSQPAVAKAKVRINEEERVAEGRMGALYRFPDGLQGRMGGGLAR